VRYNEFEDGDKVRIVTRTESGEEAESTAEYSGLIWREGRAYLQYYLWREDGCTDEIPIERVVAIELIEPVKPEDRLQGGFVQLDEEDDDVSGPRPAYKYLGP
jgi:hypothetical protein